MIEAILAGFALSSLNLMASLIIIRIAYKKEIEKFNRIILLSMVVRIIVLLGGVWFGIKLLMLETMPFVMTVFVSVFIFILFEIVFIHKHKIN